MEGITFDELGVCTPCRSSEEKMHINWKDRQSELIKILNKFKNKNYYDCILPISGGKDSTFQAYVLDRVYKVNSLAVTHGTNWMSLTGRYNLENCINKFNLDHLLFLPNRKTINKVARKSPELIGDACWHCHIGSQTFPMQTAVKWQIPLMIYGESIAERDGRGSYKKILKPKDKYYYGLNISAKVEPIKFVDSDIKYSEVQIWNYPSKLEMIKSQIIYLHLGDYIYEYGPEAGAPRQHNGPEIVTLEDYRNRHALYKTDPYLQAAHAACPWLVTWDDHEVDNNYANLIPEDNQTLEAFTQRRVNAYQAYYEHMPLRRSSLPNGADMLLYRRFTFGNLAEFNVLDTRQYRTDQPCDDGLKPRCAEALDSNATMNGSEQEQWLLTGLDQSRSRWNIIAQQTMFAQYNFNSNPEPAVFNVDQWDGYVAERDRILNFLNQRQPSNPVIITGDIHSSWVHDLKLDFDNPNSPTVGTEFVGTSISSDFPAQFIAPVQASLTNNPHTKFFDGAFRGYVRCKLTPGLWQSDYRAVSSIIDLNASVKTLASFVVEDGQPGALVN
jgi:hypothetical protein